MLIMCQLFLYNLLFLVFFHLYRKLNLQKKTFANGLLAKTVSKNSKKNKKPFADGLLAKLKKNCNTLC
jgi:hypothetical protein